MGCSPMNNKIKKNMALLFTVLFFVIFAVWLLFYIFMAGNIYLSTEKQLDTTAKNIVSDLGSQFNNLEQVSYNLSGLEDMRKFTVESNIEVRLAHAKRIKEYLKNSRYNPSFADNLIVFGSNNNFYRFAGKMPNNSCSYLGNVIKNMNLPEHININLAGKGYIGYGISVLDEEKNGTGVIVMLIEEEQLREVFYNYNPDNSLLIAVAAGGKIIAANTQTKADLEKLSTDKVGAVIKKHIGVTPFEIIVSANDDYLKSSTYYFTIAATLTVLVFFAALFIFAREQGRRFFIPIAKVMQSVETLDSYNSENLLPATESEEFDRLIEKINDMLRRLDKKNDEVVRSQLLLKNSEIEKQKALIFSLKKQINAHFTINTLSTIKILVERSDLETASSVIEGLSDIVRYAFNKDEFITLLEEMSLLRDYIAIMNTRYNNKLELRLEIDDSLMDIRIPRMLLQPLLENAILHGFRNRDEGCIIEVCAEDCGGKMRISVKDNGDGIDENTLYLLEEKLNFSQAIPEGIENIALANIKNRLSSQYGGEYLLSVENGDEKGAVVIIEIPASR